MKLEHQVTSLELSKRLKELGVKQESLFCWSLTIDNFNEAPRLHYKKCPPDHKGSYGREDGKWVDGGNQNWEEKYFSAFTVAELGEMLPTSVWIEGKLAVLSHSRNEAKTHFGIYGKTLTGIIMIEMIMASTEADARARMFIYLLENKLITL